MVLVVISLSTTKSLENEGFSQISPPQELLISFFPWSKTHILNIQSISLYLFSSYRFSFFIQQHRYFSNCYIVFQFQWLSNISWSGYAIISLVLTNNAASNFSIDIFGMQFILSLKHIKSLNRRISCHREYTCVCSYVWFTNKCYASVTLHYSQLEIVWLGILLGRDIVTTARNFLNYYKI